MRIEPITVSSGLSVAGAQGVGTLINFDRAAGQDVSRETEPTAASPVHEPQPSPRSQEEIDAAIRSIQDVVREKNISLLFRRDEQTGTMVMELVDQKSGEPVLQIPSEAQLRLAEVLGKLQGNIFNQQA